MRLLREVSDEQVGHMLVDALHDEDIESDLRAENGGASVWVHDELELERAEALCERWLAPDARDALQVAAYRGRNSRERKQARELREQRQLERAEKAMQNLRRPRPTPLTLAMIALSVGIYILVSSADDRGVIANFWIVDPREIGFTWVRFNGIEFRWLHLPWREPWRFLTPIFAHGGFMHILFNMMWLHGLGSVIEQRHGTTYLLAFVIVCGALSNVAQFEIGQSPAFVGMSGVVYGLLGLIWTRGRLDPFAGYAINTFTVQFMLLWLVLGFVMPGMSMANWCHLGGLAVGCAWGAVEAKRRRSV